MLYIGNKLHKIDKDMSRGHVLGHLGHLEDLTRTIERQQRTIEGLQEERRDAVEELNSLKSAFLDLKGQFEEIQRTQKDKDMSPSPSRTDIKDNRGQENPIRPMQGREIRQPRDPHRMTYSQETLIKTLFLATEPLDYHTLAAQMGMRPKTLRNLIYETREKGIRIMDMPLGNRKKGFYIPHEEKLRISGR